MLVRVAETESSPSRKAEQSQATRAALLKAARELFGERGFNGVATEEVVEAAGVTRGALYHHFEGKEDLFSATYEALEGSLMEQIASRAMTAGDPLAALHSGAQAFLDASEDPAIQRICLLDAPSVLGWERWREIGLHHALGLIATTLQEAMDASLIDPQPVRPLAHLLLGAIDEAAMLIAHADDEGRTRREVGESVRRYIDMLGPRA